MERMGLQTKNDASPLAAQEPIHTPVLLAEVLSYLNLKPKEFIADGTLGGGGYAEAIIARIPGGIFLGFDADLEAVAAGGPRIERLEANGVHITLVSENFSNIPEFVARRGLGALDGMVLDLGLSTDQIERSGRGFSFLRDEPLIMTYDANAVPLRDMLPKLSEGELEQILREFGEERYARRIARAIKATAAQGRSIRTSGVLADIVRRAVPKSYEHGRIHPATRTFLAFRIWVNKELEHLGLILDAIPKIMRDGGRVCIVSFHSLEDRIVKQHFQKLARAGAGTILTGKPVRPSREEIARNPNARSAKLRAIRMG